MITGRHIDADEAPHHHPMVRGARVVERLVVVQEVAGSNPVTHPITAEQFA